MTILLIYATNSSGTLLAAEIVRDVLQATGHTVTMKRANAVDPKEMKSFDHVILGSCTWDRMDGQTHLQGQLQEHMFELKQKLQGTILPGHKFSVFGLGDSSYSLFCRAVDELQTMVNDLGAELVGEPLRIDGFFFHQDRNEQQVREWVEGLIAT
ncbi:MAG: flavodoxin family protein [Candidatus Kerfeldbacteria bacterium]|nr:flavodoxin family protein [Candidatus Kerfeldbacteria bacterium]